MKITYFNSETLEQATRYSDPIISVAGKSGYITFSKSAAEKLRMTAADKMEFVQIEDEGRTDHYLFLNGSSGFQVAENTNDRLMVRNVALARKLLTAQGFEKMDSARFLVAGSVEVEGNLLHVLICKTKKK